MTPDQRRAFIDTYRRSQPIEELQRKAGKAKRRRAVTMEQTDLDLAQHNRQWRNNFDFKPPTHYCSICGQFGRQPWIESEKRYSGPIMHKPRCSWASDDGPYPGWSAVSSQITAAARTDERHDSRESARPGR